VCACVRQSYKGAYAYAAVTLEKLFCPASNASLSSGPNFAGLIVHHMLEPACNLLG